MISNYFFSLLAMIIMVLFSGVFFGLYFSDKKQKFAGWTALTYVLASLGYFTDINRSAFTHATADFLVNGIMWTAGLCLIKAVYVRVSKPFPFFRLAVITCIMIAVQSWFSLVHDAPIMRSIMLGFLSGIALLSVLPAVWRKSDNIIDKVVFWIVLGLATSYILKSAFTLFFTGGDYAQANSAYSSEAMVRQLITAVASLTGAVTLLIAAGYDAVMRTQRLNTIDPLTHVLNRRGYEELLDQKSENIAELGTGRAALMFDIDNFKQVNDAHGHQTGDAVLVRMAETAKSILECHGEVARVGGEEFAIILNRASSGMAHEIAEHLRLAFSLLMHPELPESEFVTASFGVAHVEQGETLKRAFHRADAALYAAKDRGRNRVVDAKNLRRRVRMKNAA